MATYEFLQALRPFSEIVGSNQYVFLEVGKGPHMSIAIITNEPPTEKPATWMLFSILPNVHSMNNCGGWIVLSFSTHNLQLE